MKYEYKNIPDIDIEKYWLCLSINQLDYYIIIIMSIQEASPVLKERLASQKSGDQGLAKAWQRSI